MVALSLPLALLFSLLEMDNQHIGMHTQHPLTPPSIPYAGIQSRVSLGDPFAPKAASVISGRGPINPRPTRFLVRGTRPLQSINHAYPRAFVYVCVCICARARACFVCVCVCVPIDGESQSETRPRPWRICPAASPAQRKHHLLHPSCFLLLCPSHRMRAQHHD